MELDANRSLIVSYLVGGRHAEYADAFMFDLAGRLTSWVQLTTDGHKVYLETVEGGFDADMGYAILGSSTARRRAKPRAATAPPNA